MELIIDANVLVAAFLKAATTRSLLFNPRLRLFSPDHLLIETRDVLRGRLARRLGQITETEFDDLFAQLTDGITVLSQDEYKPSLGNALEIAPHEEDAPYLACALHRGIPLWSNDSGIRGQTVVKVFTTDDLLKELASH